MSECILLFVVATQENRQADYHCQTENNVPGNQQGVFLSPNPPFWTHDNGWWGYYPLLYPGISNESYPYHPDNTAYIYFPIYNQNYPSYPQFDSSNCKNSYSNVYPPYMVPVSLQNCNNFNHSCEQANNDMDVSKIPPTMNIPDILENIQENNELENKILKENNDAYCQEQWEKGNDMARTASNNSRDSDCTTAMNITDEEEFPDEIVASEENKNDQQSEKSEIKSCPNGSLNVNVPNYTYIDTSDSSDSSDSTDSNNSTDSESQSDNESIIESSKSDNNSDDSSSDSDDSDSYLAYSTGLNPHGRLDKDENDRNSMRDYSNKEYCNEDQEASSKNNSDSESDMEEQESDMEKKEKKTDVNTFPHKLSVIYEDIERPDSESPRPQIKNVKDWNKTPFEATDDPPDDSDAPTVSVSLPLRFKFSVSENNEDVTTVIVGDSTIKPDRDYNKEEKEKKKKLEIQENNNHLEKINDVSANFLIKNNTSVNFTVKKEVKKESFDDTRKEKNHSRIKEDEDPVVPHVNFTLRKIPTRFNKINFEETELETEFTIKRKSSVKKEEDKTIKPQEEHLNSTNVKNNDSVGKESLNKENNTVYITRIKETGLETRDINRNILKPEVIVSECKWADDSTKECSNKFQNTNSNLKDKISLENNDSLKKNKIEEDIDEKAGKESKHLLNVQNSREETDDEDSGVTSDMSRMISEVDTDSECTSSKNRKYQRTQTHSRLFRLLNDDSILPEDTEKINQSSSREYLSLPLKSNNFNYDENYCSNYSSGVTSPEYSPISEQSWKRLHDADQNGDVYRRQDRTSCKEDPYYQAWKTPKSSTPVLDHDVIPSLAFKILESRRPPWSYKVNVLCPRIKSTKSVPQTLKTGKQTNSTVSSSNNSSSFQANLKNDHC